MNAVYCWPNYGYKRTHDWSH